MSQINLKKNNLNIEINLYFCWKLYNTLIILNLIDIYKGFVYFYITKQPVCSTCFIVPYMALFHVLTTRRYVFPSKKPRVVSGSQPKRGSKVVESSE